MKTNSQFPIAIIDVGSNSVRLMLFTGETKQKFTITTRLGEGLSFTDKLSKIAIDRTVDAISYLYKVALQNDAKSIYCFATAAVRNSSNGNEFTSLVKEKTGIIVDVVSGDLEAELAVLGSLNNQDGGVIDVGGASTEICVKQNGKITYSYSLKTGAVKIYDGFGRNSAQINDFLSEFVKEYGNVPKVDFKAVGGTSCALASIDLKLTEYSDEKVDGHYISKLRLEEILLELSVLSPKEISEKYAVNNKRAETVLGGGLIFLNIIKYLNIDGITVTTSDNLEGYLYKEVL